MLWDNSSVKFYKNRDLVSESASSIYSLNTIDELLTIGAHSLASENFELYSFNGYISELIIAND